MRPVASSPLWAGTPTTETTMSSVELDWTLQANPPAYLAKPPRRDAPDEPAMRLPNHRCALPLLTHLAYNIPRQGLFDKAGKGPSPGVDLTLARTSFCQATTSIGFPRGSRVRQKQTFAAYRFVLTRINLNPLWPGPATS